MATEYTPMRPVWYRTAVTSTTPAVIYVPPGVRYLKIWADVLSLFSIGSTYAAPSVTPVSAVYTIRTTGTPTGGTFKLTFDGQETATIAYNAAAATIVTALDNLSNINSGDFVGAGGALPTDVTLAAGATYAASGPLPNLTATSVALTGGTAPSVQVVRSTKGTGLNNKAGGYGYIEATKEELIDIGSGPSRAGGATAQSRYLYVATATGAGNYRATGYILA